MEKKYTDCLKMFKDIAKHVEKNGNYIERKNIPEKLTSGFFCSKTNTHFTLRLGDMRKSLEFDRNLLDNVGSYLYGDESQLKIWLDNVAQKDNNQLSSKDKSKQKVKEDLKRAFEMIAELASQKTVEA